MEMFDAVVVVISFTLDLVFVQGLTASNMRSFVVILSFLLPWRVLRVLNSLIVALMHQNRFHLKVLYKQKRKITKQYQDATESIELLEKQVKVLKNLCNKRGIHDWEINKAIAQTIKPTAKGGLKTLGTLIFKAAESFATLSVPKMNDCTSTAAAASASSASCPGNRSPSVGLEGPARCHSVPFTLSCNGDMLHHQRQQDAPNGHTTVLGEEDLQLEESPTSTSTDHAESLSTPSSKGKGWSRPKSPPLHRFSSKIGRGVSGDGGGQTGRTSTTENGKAALDSPSGSAAEPEGQGIAVAPRGDPTATAGVLERDTREEDVVPVVLTAGDSASVVRFPDQSAAKAEQPSEGVVRDAPHERGRSGSKEKAQVVEGMGTKPTFAGGGGEGRRSQREGGPTAQDHRSADKGERQPSVDDSDRSTAPRFYLSSDDSEEADAVTPADEGPDPSADDGVFTKL